MASTHLGPVLRLVPVPSVRFHEHPERRRTEKLLARLSAEKMLRNPPIVASMSPGEYLLLDGANRVSAFKDLALSHIAVQVVDYGDDQIQLRRWHHLLLEGGALDLRTAYAEIEGITLKPVPQSEVFRRLELREVFAALVDEGQSCWGLFPNRPDDRYDLQLLLRVLEQVVRAYEGRIQLERIKLADPSDIPEVFSGRDHQLVLFPHFSKSELVQLVAQDLRIPTGITRHVIPGRALGLNLELGFLSELSDEQAKIEHFQAYLDQLQLEGRIRFYQESVYILNE
jgi:hypothetical protein